MHFSYKRFALILSLLTACNVIHAHNLDLYKNERDEFKKALSYFSKGDHKRFEAVSESLKEYALHPYLEYESIGIHSRKLPFKEIDRFLEKHADSPVALKMRVKLLNKLVKRHDWQRYISYWDSSIKDARLNCWYQRSKYRTGFKKEALDSAKALWLKASSQPKACDPLFKEWINEGYLTQDIAWQRLELAMDARRIRLARYIVRRLLEGEFKDLGQQYIYAHRKPQRLAVDKHGKRTLELAAKYPEKMEKVVSYGLKRLARKDVEKAQTAWKKYSVAINFKEVNTKAIRKALAIGSAIAHTGEVVKQDLELFAEASPSAIEQRIRMAMRENDWPSIFQLIQMLPEDAQSSTRWQYWLARTIDVQNIREDGLPLPKEIYQQLAEKRSYYGFLAADLLGQAYAMEDQPAQVTQASIETLSENDAMIRALELYALGRIDDARREWRFASRSIDSSLLLAAGKFAENFSWYEKAIRAYIKASYWDDLKTRFPLAYKNKFIAASEDKKLDSSWVYAIARQESAFSADARSHAGALGLMQLMPGTAKQTAKKIGIKKRLKRADILKPETNIKLGSSYLKQMLEKFDGNRILATAAYNAGPHRVKRWLKDSQSNLPFDVWIETIPFKETRSYVQNVLAFSVIYDYRMAQPTRMLSALETEQML